MDLETTVLEAIHRRYREVFGDRFKLNELMARHTSARVGGPAEMFVTVGNATELQMAVELAYAQHIPYFVLGGGSNILVADGGIGGLVILNKARNVRFRHTGLNVVCTAESGMNLSSLARQCIAKGLGGLEWAVNVPGTVGGAVVGNSGAHGGDTNSNLLAATIWEPGLGARIYSNEEMAYGYRDSVLKREQRSDEPRRVVLSAELVLKPEPVEVLLARADGFVARRKQTQPGGASMGSMFKNPPHYYAGYLIDAAGLKGFRSGGAHISEKHANFFINDDDATAEDIRALIAEAWNVVREQFGVELELEVELIGNWHFDEEVNE
ncbi:MAG: UDP-N-acetylmuramate dehydrogenase [Chloroflexi bacterium]|nr:UDP-N-acetylmuramate dehydrogenase [Chloroflexota bacterium]MCI0575398.1 UDP-N-acetylmuramate dehydrogenase [Chloroflexota bacterium]MCI0645454.1 UDP-N-acetylmuramate dehydrogenase [Chloroflexota bacterium]MCI0726721.1 UDP-N-acetylmuramate dehydrogenase [Chloroflexota bacterium]